MVKRPQTQIGYFVDGVLVRRPNSKTPRPPSLDGAKNSNTHPGGLGLSRYPKKKLKTLVEKSEFYESYLHASYKSPVKGLSENGIYDEELKNAVKVNNMLGGEERRGAKRQAEKARFT